MKLLFLLPARGARREARGGFAQSPKPKAAGPVSAFTMIEIALCLAIIGFALVSILLVLPLGMNTQRDTRQETIIGQDASVLLDAIRSGARGMDDLANYVYAITNYYSSYDNLGVWQNSHIAGYTSTAASLDSGPDILSMHLTNGLRIIGLLSTPEFTAGSGGPALVSTFGNSYTSNHIVAYIRSFSGLVAEKPPQDNPIMREDAFAYRLYCVNAPMSVSTNNVSKMAGNLRELRLTFLWPQQPNGNVGNFKQTFRASVAGQLVVTNYDTAPAHLFPGIANLYFYQSQSFAP